LLARQCDRTIMTFAVRRSFPALMTRVAARLVRLVGGPRPTGIVTSRLGRCACPGVWSVDEDDGPA